MRRSHIIAAVLVSLLVPASPASAQCRDVRREGWEGVAEISRERREMRRDLYNSTNRSEARRAIREGAREIARERREARRAMRREMYQCQERYGY